MDWNKFRSEAFKTWNPETKGIEAIEYIHNKLIEEVVEILACYTKNKFHGKPTNYKEEMGDLAYYIAALESITGDNFFRQVKGQYELIRGKGCDSKTMIMMINSISGVDKLPHIGVTANAIFNQLLVMLDFNLEEVLDKNIAKLRKRHGESYNAKHYAIERKNI